MATLAELIETYVAGPPALRAAVAGMTREQLVARPVPGKWSTLEVVARCSCAVAHLSTAVGMAALMEKPLLLATSRELAAIGYGDRLASVAATLGVALVDADAEAPLASVGDDPAAWPRRYADYVDRYVRTPGIPIRLTWDIVADHLCSAESLPASRVR